MISAELTDPRLEDAMISVTSVVVSPDLRNARVFIEHALPPEASSEVLAALHHAEGFLRRALAENLNLRFIPELSFRIDLTSARASRIDALLDTVAAPVAHPTGTPRPEHRGMLSPGEDEQE